MNIWVIEDVERRLFFMGKTFHYGRGGSLGTEKTLIYESPDNLQFVFVSK